MWYWQVINNVSSWLASPMISMLNLISGFTCDINYHILTLNSTLEEYISCLTSLLTELINVRLDYIEGTYDSHGNYYYEKNYKITESASYQVKNLLLDENNMSISLNTTCSDNGILICDITNIRL